MGKSRLDAKRAGSLFTSGNALSLLAAVALSLAAISLTSNIPALSEWGYPGVFLISLISSATVFVPVPGFAAVFAMGRVLDPLLLGAVAGIGAGIGELSGYLAGFAGHGALANSKTFLSHRKQMEKGGLPALFFLAFLPNPAFDIAGIAAGAMRVPVWQFLLAVSAGKTLRFVLLALAGGATAGWF